VLKQWRLWLGILVSLVFLALAFRNPDFASMSQALLSADYRYLIPAVAVYFVGVYIRALRWQALLRSVKPMAIGTLFPIVVIGYMANNLLPARAGELVRAYVLSRRAGVTKSTSLATVAIERIFDGLTMILFILVAALLIRINQQVEFLAVIATVLFVGLLIGLALFGAVPALQNLLLGLLRRLLPARLEQRIETILLGFVGGLASLRSRGDVARIVLTSVLAWSCEAAMYWIIALAFDLQIGWPAALLATAVANLFTLLPSSPGYVGIFEAGVLLVLVGLLGRDQATALSFALVLHAALWLPVTALGLLFWSRESFSWRTLGHLPTDEAPPDLTGARVSRPTGTS
jgi:glycosyltransferase 2 family protein